MSQVTPDSQGPDAAPPRAEPPTESTSEPTSRGPSRVHKDPLRRSRVSGAWVAVVALAVLLLLLVIFIAQNTQDATVSFLGWDGRAPLAVWLLIATLVGILVAVIAGTGRILQLRHRVRSAGTSAR